MQVPSGVVKVVNGSLSTWRLNVAKGPPTRTVLPVPSRVGKKISGPKGGRRRCWGVYVRQPSFHQIRHYTMRPGDFMWGSWVGGEVAA